MIYKLNLEETYETRQSISIEVLTERELTGTEKAALVAFAQAHVAGRKEKPAAESNWARCPCCQRRFSKEDMRYLDHQCRGQLFCRNCLPTMLRAVEIVTKREETRAKQGG